MATGLNLPRQARSRPLSRFVGLTESQLFVRRSLGNIYRLVSGFSTFPSAVLSRADSHASCERAVRLAGLAVTSQPWREMRHPWTLCDVLRLMGKRDFNCQSPTESPRAVSPARLLTRAKSMGLVRLVSASRSRFAC